MPFPRPLWGLLVLLFLALSAAFASPRALAATSSAGDITLTIDREDIGLRGVTRPGTWTPVRLHLTDRSAHPMSVVCRWELTDTDGDIVVSQRSATLTPSREQVVWIYACPSLGNDTAAASWRFSVVDTSNGQETASLVVKPDDTLPSSTRMIASTTSLSLGLAPYHETLAQPESTEVLRGLNETQFPDRPYGLAAISTLIWTPDGPDPASLAPELIQSIREWVRTGGHLVLILPSQGDMWSSSRMADMLPKVTITSQPDQWLPDWMGESATSNRQLRVSTHTLVPAPGEGVSVLLRDTYSRPLAVASGFGLGRITLIGLDLTDPRIVQKGLPAPIGNTRKTLWNAVFNWSMPVYSRDEVAKFEKSGEIKEANARQDFSLDLPLLRSRIEMHETFGAALVLAIIMFGVYWLLAGPVSFGLLKWQKRAHLSWIVFCVVVLVASVIAWVGAWLIRPSNNRIAHLSVLQMDMETGVVSAQSQVSIFVKDQSRVQVAVDSGREKGNYCTIASPGLSEESETAHALEPLRIEIDSGAPHSAMIPFRATSKQFVISYSDSISPGVAPTTPGVWPLPLGRIHLFNQWPEGKVTHQFPGVMKNVVLVYCPGTPEGRAMVWKADVDEWKPGEPLRIARPSVRPPDLIAPPSKADYLRRNLTEEGNLGDIASKIDPYMGPHPATNEMVSNLMLLSFYDALPPPEFRFKDSTEAYASRSINFRRSWGRTFDLTRETGLARLLILGHIENSDPPIPLTVDSGHLPSSAGWTMVQLVIPIEESPRPENP